MKRLHKLILACAAQEISDIHIVGGHPVVVRKHGEIHKQQNVAYKHQEVDALVKELLDDRQLAILRNHWSVDTSRFIPPCSVRFNIANTSRGLSISIRLLPASVPSLDALNLHPSLKELCKAQHGLILFCGPTGSGKTSTIAAMLNEINMTRNAHVLTLEDPIEYRFQSVKCFFEQRELGVHFHEFSDALIDSLRQMPDIILVGELREPEVIQETLNIAESGHLVFGTLHAGNSEEAIYRICSAFDPEIQELVRLQLASTLRAIIVQRLWKMPKLNFRVPLLSILINTPAVKNTLRENKISTLENIIQVASEDGMFTVDRYRDYLMKQKSFTSPSAHFMDPRSKTMKIKDYTSPLIDTHAQSKVAFGPGAKMPAVSAPMQAPVKAPNVAFEGLPSDMEETTNLIIDSDQNIEDLIQQMDQK